RHALAAIDVALGDLVVALGRELVGGTPRDRAAAGEGRGVGGIDLAGHHRQRVIALGQPLVRGGLHFGGRGRHRDVVVLLPGARIIAVDLPFGQRYRLAGETADLFQTANGRRLVSGLDARQFVGGRAVLQEF